MARHTVSFDDLEKWAAESWNTFASSFGDAENKSLAVNMRGRYRVQDHRKTVYEGDNPLAAITHYNDL
jgi:hypothetical protein